jgi:hypothetical protein
VNKKSIVSFALAILLCPISTTCADNLPSIDDVITKYIKAAGGRELLAKSWALRLRGTLESSNDEESGPLELVAYGPRLFMRINNGAVLMGVNESVFWRHERGREILKVPASTIAETVAVFDSARVVHWKDRYPQIAVTAMQTVDNRQVYVIESKPGDPAAERLFIDRHSDLIVRDEVAQKHETFTFGDFRSVDGVKIPFVIHQTTPTMTYVYQFSEAKHVTKVDESMFKPQ